MLELDNCPLITDRTLEHLVSCHNLQRIELFDCQLISRAAIRKLKVRLIYGYINREPRIIYRGYSHLEYKVEYTIICGGDSHLES